MSSFMVVAVGIHKGVGLGGDWSGLADVVFFQDRGLGGSDSRAYCMSFLLAVGGLVAVLPSDSRTPIEVYWTI